MTQTLDARSWRAIVQQLKRGNCVPLLSNQIGFSDLFAVDVVSTWANEVGYPFDIHHLTRVAQFINAQYGDSYITKEEYLEFLKQQLLRQRRAQWLDQQVYLDMVEDELNDLSVSKTVTRLHYFDFERQPNHPLRQLASLNIPLFLTTSHHSFIEDALKSVGKEPQTAICNWYSSAPIVNNFTPEVATPLVYHLHGHDSQPVSLVLTDDDHFDFLMAIARDFDQIIPNVVMRALSDSSLILLGYQLLSSEFSVIFRGLIKEKADGRRPSSLSIQLASDDIPNPTAAKEFVRNYFKGHHFEVYWGDMTAFIEHLWQEAH